MHRNDKDTFLKNMTFGFIPAGTGNGLIKSILSECEEEGDLVLASAFLICKGRQAKLDLTEL